MAGRCAIFVARSKTTSICRRPLHRYWLWSSGSIHNGPSGGVKKTHSLHATEVERIRSQAHKPYKFGVKSQSQHRSRAARVASSSPMSRHYRAPLSWSYAGRDGSRDHPPNRRQPAKDHRRRRIPRPYRLKSPGPQRFHLWTKTRRDRKNRTRVTPPISSRICHWLSQIRSQNGSKPPQRPYQ